MRSLCVRKRGLYQGYFADYVALIEILLAKAHYVVSPGAILRVISINELEREIPSIAVGERKLSERPDFRVTVCPARGSLVIKFGVQVAIPPQQTLRGVNAVLREAATGIAEIIRLDPACVRVSQPKSGLDNSDGPLPTITGPKAIPFLYFLALEANCRCDVLVDTPGQRLVEWTGCRDSNNASTRVTQLINSGIVWKPPATRSKLALRTNATLQPGKYCGDGVQIRNGPFLARHISYNLFEIARAHLAK